MKRRITIDRIIWLFVIGCLLGFGIETLWHFLKNQEWINKQGLLYGPFKPIYGFGMVLFVLIFSSYRDKSKVWLFFFGTLLGTGFEYLCSVFQEVVFGTYTWTYAHFKYSISSRIYLPYCLLWGLLTLVIIKGLYPLIEKWIAKLPKRLNVVLVSVLGVFMCVNVSLTAIAIGRMADRVRGDTATNSFEKWVDDKYNDAVMQKKFPKLRVIVD